MYIKAFYIMIIGLLISGMSFSQTEVKKVTSNVAIDGQLEESFWDISNQISINLGGSDNTANFGVLWDETYLYIGVNVTDNTLCMNGRMGWWDDGVEIYIDGNYSQGTSFDQYDRLFVKPVKSYWIQEGEERIEGVVHQWIETNDGYSMEFAIPWDNFNITPVAGINIGFDIAINDDDYCSSYNSLSQLLWSGAAYYYKNPSTWGTLNLSNQTVYYSGDYIALLSPNGGDFCINDITTSINWVNQGITNINIDCSTDSGSSWNSIVTNLPAGSGSFSWNVSANPSEQCLIKVSDTDNSSVNDISENLFTVSSTLTAVEPLIPNIWDNYLWPYNAYYPEDSNGVNGHVGNACGHSSLARILHYWEFPIVGNDELTFTDNGGHTWSANFGETTYNYDNMPNYLPENSTEEEYTDVATLFYHAATSMNDIYGSGGDLNKMSFAMSHYFRYKESAETSRKNYTKAEWIQTMKNELDNGRVLLVQGMTLTVPGNWHETNNIAGHWYHVDGYNEAGYFHVVVGFGDSDGFYDADSLSGYAYNLGILTGLEPELNGKELSLESHNGGEVVGAGEETKIIWNSTNVSNISIKYTLNNGQDWDVIIGSTPASDGSYYWTTPDVSTDECKIKLTDVTDINIYDRSNDVFSIEPYELTLNTPIGGNYYIPGDLVSISWENTPVSDINIDYSTDNGSNWLEITASTSSASGSYDWVIPNEISSQCLVKISDVSDPTVFDISDENFEIGTQNIIGGHYAVDDNTILLLHFEGDLVNLSPLSDDGIPHGDGISFDPNSPLFLGQCLKLDNSNGTSYITIPHNENLNLTGDWTIEAWFYIENSGSGASWNPTIISKSTSSNENYLLWFHHSWDAIKGQYKNTFDTDKYVSVFGTVTSGQWYHIAYIKDADNSTETLRIHDQNRVLITEEIVQQEPSQTTPLLNSEDVYIGKILLGEVFYFDGYIDEVRISNVVRSFEDELHANFMANKISGIVPLQLNFTDLSSQGDYAITQWNWDFGDGTSSTLQNPDHTFQNAGTYTVSLTVTDANSDSDTEVKTDYITVSDPVGPIAVFYSNLTSGINPLEIEFTDRSTQGTATITQWSWDFGDGTTSSLQNPEHTYQNTGTFTVSLTVTDTNDLFDTEVKTDYITVSVLPEEASNPDPEDQATLISVSAELSWTICDSTETIDLYLGTDNPPTDLILDNVAAVITYDPDNLDYETNYYWKVICRNSFGATEGPVWSFTTDAGIGISDNYPDNGFLIYPNPADKNVYIDVPEEVDFSILTMTGQKILEKKNFQSGVIDVSGFEKGIYIVIFSCERRLVTRKLIIK